MLTGAHTIIYSQPPETDRAFFRDVLGLENVDAGQGRRIFSLPPSELGFHPSETTTHHKTYLLCEDIEAFVSHVSSHGVNCTEVTDEGWGLLTHVSLPGGSIIGVFQPSHKRP